MSFHSYASRIGSKPMLAGSLLEMNRPFPFIRFTNWKQALVLVLFFALPLSVSIHTLHELEARLQIKPMFSMTLMEVSIHTLHELEARSGLNRFPITTPKVSIHTLHELEARGVGPVWEQTLSLSFHSYASRIGSKTGAWVALTDDLTGGFHSYASRIGSKKNPHMAG